MGFGNLSSVGFQIILTLLISTVIYFSDGAQC